MQWNSDPAVEKKLKKIIEICQLDYIRAEQITFFRSFGSSSRAYARIWGLPHVWQQALKIEPHYIIEIISEHFDRLSVDDQTKTLIHELLHIPKKFSGSLVPHRGNRHFNINHRIVDQIYQRFKDQL